MVTLQQLERGIPGAKEEPVELQQDLGVLEARCLRVRSGLAAPQGLMWMRTGQDVEVCVFPPWELYRKLPNKPAQNPSPVAYFIDFEIFFHQWTPTAR